MAPPSAREAAVPRDHAEPRSSLRNSEPIRTPLCCTFMPRSRRKSAG
jgi:hypothetical protein